MPSIGVHIKLNQIQTRTNLGHKQQWKKWCQIQNLLGILLKLFGKATLKGLYISIEKRLGSKGLIITNHSNQIY